MITLVIMDIVGETTHHSLLRAFEFVLYMIDVALCCFFNLQTSKEAEALLEAPTRWAGITRHDD